MSKNLKKTKALVIVLTLMSSCSQIKELKIKGNEGSEHKGFTDDLISKIVPRWFTGPKEFSLQRSTGGEAAHMFYDISPDINLKQYSLNFIVTTPKGSPFSYLVDLASGQHVLERAFCIQDDIWKQYGGSIFKPPVTLGIVPKILDQIGEPQKIIVFGDKKKFSQNFTRNYFDARVIGGFIEQVCPSGPCRKNKEWKSRIVLIGVQKDNEKFKGVKNVQELREKVDWPKVEAFVENGQGVNRIGENVFPAFRMGALISSDQTLRYLDKNSVYLKNSKLLAMRKSCHKLYDHIWNKVGIDSEYESELKKLNLAIDRLKYIKENKPTSDSLFFKRFKKSFGDYGKEYKTCMKFIYPSNINHNSKRHWFFSYYTAIHLLNELNYSFDCNRNMWVRNTRTRSTKRITALENEFKGCSARKIDSAFEQAIPFLDSLRKKHFHSFRYVDYDGGGFGTHNKVYSWVLDNNKVLSCKEEADYPVQYVMETFPKDIRWERRKLKIKIKRKL